MVSPPKPWERNGSPVAASPPTMATTSLTPTTAQSLSASLPPSTTTTTTTTSLPSSAQPPLPPTSSSASSPPTVPDRPTSLTSPAMSSTMSPYSYGSSPYSRFGTYGGGLGSYGGFGSAYSGGYGLGGMGTYGGMGSYGSMGYGGMGYGGMGGMGMGMGMNPMGMGFDAHGNPIPSLTQTLESTTQHTFALIHSIVQTFSGVAQMLESTFMATHSSFFAMVGVVDQFSQLRNALGSVLGLFGLMRWMKELITGRRAPTAQIQHEFRDFVSGKPVQGPLGPPTQPNQPKASKKPLIIFLLAVFGIPYAMTKLIRILQERAQQQQAQNGGLLPGQPLPPLDPSQLTFARALYPFQPSNPTELALKENEIVAIMGKLDSRTGMEVDPRLEVEGEWWKGRTREGREGWFPKKWVEVLERKKDEPKVVD